jgi:hypothetical protein
MTCENVIRSKIWADVLAGRRVAVCVRHAKEAKRMNTWLQKEVRAHNGQSPGVPMLVIPSVAWMAAWCKSRDDSPASDATQWLTAHNVVGDTQTACFPACPSTTPTGIGFVCTCMWATEGEELAVWSWVKWLEGSDTH